MHLSQRPTFDAPLSRTVLQVFPELYLPVMTENNLRVLKPWRAYLPSLAQLRHKDKVRRLNSYVKRLVHRRWAERQQSGNSAAHNQDVLERIMQALEVSMTLQLAQHDLETCSVTSYVTELVCRAQH